MPPGQVLGTRADMLASRRVPGLVTYLAHLFLLMTVLSSGNCGSQLSRRAIWSHWKGCGKRLRMSLALSHC